MRDRDDLKKELAALRKAARRYLNATLFVPMRAVDCDQEEEERARAQLARLSNWKYTIGGDDEPG